MRLSKRLVLTGIGLGGVAVCGLAPDAVAAWAAPLFIAGFAAIAMAMPSEPGDGEGGAASSDGVAVGGDGGNGGGGDGDDGGDGGGDGGGE